jgi:hypothetical protein
MNSQQIGKSGELLIQYKLLKLGIESSPLTTDSGIDLVAFSHNQRKAYTIQVKTNEKPKPGGGKGSLALDWWLKKDSPADLITVVDVSGDRAWLFTCEIFSKVAQQNSKGNLHFYMYIDASVKTKKLAKLNEFDEYIFERQARNIFNIQQYAI